MKARIYVGFYQLSGPFADHLSVMVAATNIREAKAAIGSSFAERGFSSKGKLGGIHAYESVHSCFGVECNDPSEDTNEIFHPVDGTWCEECGHEVVVQG